MSKLVTVSKLMDDLVVTMEEVKFDLVKGLALFLLLLFSTRS